MKTKLDDFCKTQPGGPKIPLFDRSQTSSTYEWRCYLATSIQNYYYESGSQYYSRNIELKGILEQHSESMSFIFTIPCVSGKSVD